MPVREKLVSNDTWEAPCNQYAEPKPGAPEHYCEDCGWHRGRHGAPADPAVKELIQQMVSQQEVLMSRLDQQALFQTSYLITDMIAYSKAAIAIRLRTFGVVGFLQRIGPSAGEVLAVRVKAALQDLPYGHALESIPSSESGVLVFVQGRQDALILLDQYMQSRNTKNKLRYKRVYFLSEAGPARYTKLTVKPSDPSLNSTGSGLNGDSVKSYSERVSDVSGSVKDYFRQNHPVMTDSARTVKKVGKKVLKTGKDYCPGA